MVITIILSLLLLMFIAYRGFPVIIFAPICALLAASTAGYALLPTYTEMFMGNAVAFIKNMFPVFLLGAVFGKAMEDSGAAKAISRGIIGRLGYKHAMLAVVLATAVLAYGGISVFVVAFTIYPLGAAIFREANIPKRLLPGTMVHGSFTFVYALPGLPQVQNIIPTRYFGTDAFAGAWFGIVFGAVIFVLGMLWLESRRKAAFAAGEGYGEGHKNEPTADDLAKDEHEMPPVLAVLPLIAVLIINFFLTNAIKNWDPAILDKFPGIKLSQVAPTWALIVALIIGIFMVMAFSWKRFTTATAVSNSLTAGAIGSLLATMNTASEVGYGNVVSKLPGFKTVADFMMSIDIGSPLFSEAITVNVLAGITGSASGGMVIALEAMGQQYLEWAQRTNVSPELLHRIATMAAGGLDTLPHNGAVITVLAICGLNHRQSYKDMGMCTVVIPFTTVFVGIFLVSLF
ncbi:MAG: GntP family permease [Desulfovibrio sp.]|jgi:H+/gluconate symporter-like permease|nr:GntP family permease [Desulfovibrio sp.]